MAANKEFNRLKVVYVETKRSSFWIFRQLGMCANDGLLNCVLIHRNLHWRY